jgi:ASC-1-like (ASCH) protein
MSSRIYPIRLHSPWFQFVRSGVKIYEGRRCTPTMSDFVPGDRFLIKQVEGEESEYLVIIEAILKFPTFEIALRSLPLSQVLPNCNSVEEGVEIYKKFVSLPTQEKDGVLMFLLRVDEEVK